MTAQPSPATASPSRPDAGSGAVRDHLNQLRQHGGTYRSIAAAAAVGPTTVHELATGRRDGTGSIASALLAVTSDALLQGRLDAGGTRLRLRALHVMATAQPASHEPSAPPTRRSAGWSAATPKPSARNCTTRSLTSTTRGGTSEPRAAPAPSAPRPPSPGVARSPATGALAPASTTTNWTAPATAPRAAGNPLPAPAPPRTSAYPDDPVGTSAYERCPPVMTLTILDDSISGDHTTHTACLAPGHKDTWHVSWLPGRLMDRNSAITAMVLADVAAAGDVHAGHRLWPHIQGWAAELDLTAPDALAWISQTLGRTGIEKDGTPRAAISVRLITARPSMAGMRTTSSPRRRPSMRSETTSDPDLNRADLGILAAHQSHNWERTN
jgi:hypothetical protein